MECFVAINILLTGASGLIGSAIYNKLNKTNNIISVGRSSKSDVYFDLLNKEFNEITFPVSEVLIHSAGVTDEDFISSPENGFFKASEGAKALLNNAVASGVKTVIYISSAHVYGPMLGEISVNNPPNPISDYAIGHYITEQIFKRICKANNINLLILRPCAVFGKLTDFRNFKRWTLIPFDFPRSAIVEKKIIIKSTGLQRRNFVGSEDIANIIADALLNDFGDFKIINPLGINNLSVYEFANLCSEELNNFDGTECQVSRVLSDDPTPGEDFEYIGTLPNNEDYQSLQNFIKYIFKECQ